MNSTFAAAHSEEENSSNNEHDIEQLGKHVIILCHCSVNNLCKKKTTH